MRSTALFTTLLLAACGSKTPPPAADVAPAPPSGTMTTPPATTPPAQETATAAAPDAGTTPAPDAATPEPTAPPATVAEADVVAPSEDAEAPTVAVVEDAGAVAVAPPDVEPVALPADLPKVPGMAPEAVFRLLQKEPGCVGIGKSGRSVVSIIERGGERELRITDLSAADRGLADTGTFEVPADATALGADTELLDAVKSLRLVGCQTTLAADGGAPFSVPKPVPVEVRKDGGDIVAQIAGQKALVVVPQQGESAYTVTAAYWSPDVGNMFLRVVEAADGGKLLTAVVSAVELGASECVPRPAEGKPLGGPPPAFNIAATGCVAMTADGQAAAFKRFYVDKNDSSQSRANSIEWFGPGAKPDIDLSCMARGCKAEDKARISDEATKLGLVGCAEIRGAAAIDGMMVPFMYQDDKLKLKSTTGWRAVHEFAQVAPDAKEAMWHMWQLPSGGPIYVYVGRDDVVNTVDVKVLDEEAMKLCPPAPAGTVKAADVKVVSAASDGGGYKFGGAQLVDGDAGTCWQPDTSKGGGAGAWVELTLAGETTVSAVEIANGFQRRDGNGDMFSLNARIQEGTLTFSDGSSEKIAFGPDERGFKRFELTPRKTTSVKLTVTSLHDGSRWPKDLAVSELRVIGQAP
ncbi:MAG: discoidin domain-containing protein [Myxococcota bacterium]